MDTSRYRATTSLTKDGETYFGIPDRTVFPPSGTDAYYDVQPEDTLHKIAFRRLGNAQFWWVIAYFNDLTDPFVALEPGTTLRLPNRARLWMEVLA